MNCDEHPLTPWEQKCIVNGRIRLLHLWTHDKFTSSQPSTFAIDYEQSYTEPPAKTLDKFTANGTASSMPDAWTDFARRHQMTIESAGAHSFHVYVPTTYYSAHLYMPFEHSTGCVCQELGISLVGLAIFIAVFYTGGLA